MKLAHIRNKTLSFLPAQPKSDSHLNGQLNFYYRDDPCHYWQIKDYGKRILYLATFASTEFTLNSSTDRILKIEDIDNLGQIKREAPIQIKFTNSKYSTKCKLESIHIFAWKLTVEEYSESTEYYLIRQMTGWEIFKDSPEGPLIAMFQKKGKGNKFGQLKYVLDLDPQIVWLLTFSLCYTITTAFARYRDQFQLISTNRFDHFEKYQSVWTLPSTPYSSSSTATSSENLDP